MKKAKLLYIISMGHSGSTLLDMLCGTIPGVFSLGEVIHLPWQLYRDENAEDNQTLCSCGKHFTDCEFWKHVIFEAGVESNTDIYKQPLKYNISINRPFKYGRNIINAFYNRGLLLLLKYKLISPLINIFYYLHLNSIKRNWLLFDIIADNSKNEYVIDSSKDVMRYWFLKKFRPNDVKLIVLIRGIHGVASSSHNGLNGKIINQRVKAWLRLYKTQLIPLLKRTHIKHFTVVKYEDYCNNPNKIRNDINKFLLSDKEHLKDINFIFPHNTHMVAGNPIRHHNKIQFKYDERWQDRLTKNQIDKLNIIQEKINTLYNEKGFL